MLRFLHLCLLCFLMLSEAFGQICPSDPPLNPFLADTPYPIYHRNNYAQASTCFTGPLPGDSIAVKYRGEIQGGTSPWVYMTEPYITGERALLYSNATHVFKFVDNGETIVAVDSLRIDFDPITSFGWNYLLAKNKIWFTYDPKFDPESDEYTRLFKLTDADTSDVYSEIITLDTLNLGDLGINHKVQHFSINYSGEIVFNSDNNEAAEYSTVGVISQDFELLDTLRYATTSDEITGHNAFPIDENNSFYITTNKRLLKFTWDGTELALAWEALYDFVADGPTGTFAEGSGTTPTLMGWGEGQDKLVVMSDGHAENNLVAFWRELPEDWEGVPGMDIHFADSIQLPAAATFSNLFQSIENSPTVSGYELAIAQYNGFLGYDCENSKGVQKVIWDTENNQWEVAWVNTEINMNGVLTHSRGANMLYGSGKEIDCNYYYYGLDWDSGELVLRHLLGGEGTFLDDTFYDGGNANVIDEDGNIYFAGGSSVVKVEIVSRGITSTQNEKPIKSKVKIFPNPATRFLFLISKENIRNVEIFDANGRLFENVEWLGNGIDLMDLAAGVYFVRVRTERGVVVKKVVKQG